MNNTGSDEPVVP